MARARDPRAVSSATPIAVNRFALASNAVDADKIKRMGLTPRQQELNRKWAFYKTQQYESRSVCWDGSRLVDPLEREAAASNGVLPSLWDGRFDEMPLNMRRPSAPYHIVRVIVNRFTGILFSEDMHPQVNVMGSESPDSLAIQQWIKGLIQTTRMWSRWGVARTFGGGQGSVAVTFQFRKGRPMVEVHDSRWCFPTVVDKITGELSRLEIRYQHPVESVDASGTPREDWYWYRRIIDTKTDTVYEDAPVGDGSEPAWVVKSSVPHGLDEFPGVWVRNTPTDEVDGEADCEGVFDTAEEIDGLYAQSALGSRENADPTFAIASDELKTNDVKKGSGNGLRLKKGDVASYVEMNGAGVASAMSVAKELRRNALEVAQCVLETEQVTPATATEIERRYSSMHERGAIFREQYGENGIKPLIGKIIRAVIKLRSGVQIDPVTGKQIAAQFFLSPVEESGKLLQVDLPATLNTFDSNHLIVKWPAWVKRGPADAQAAASAVSAARSAQILDRKNAMEYVGPYFQIESIDEAMTALDAESGKLDSELVGDLMARQSTPPTLVPPGATLPPEAPKEVTPADNAKIVDVTMKIMIAISEKKLAPEAAIPLIIAVLGCSADDARAMATAQALQAALAPAPVAPPFAGGA